MSPKLLRSLLLSMMLGVASGDAKELPRGERLVITSQERIREITGCYWGQACDPGISLESPQAERFRWWRLIQGATTQEAREEIIYMDGPTYGIYWANGTPLEDAILVELHIRRFLEGVFRLRNGIKEELRPTSAQLTEDRLASYKEVLVLRQRRSFSFADIASIQHTYLHSARLKDLRGLKWGAQFQEIQTEALNTGFVLQKPQEFFAESGWILPGWKGSFERAGGRTTSHSWSPYRKKEIQCYLYHSRDNTKVRVFQVESTNGLEAIFEYSHDNKHVIIRPPAQEETTHASEVLQNLRWGQTHVSTSLVSLSNWTLNRVNPEEFFQRPTSPGMRWEESFENGNYSYRTDHSWQDPSGKRLYLYTAWDWNKWVNDTPAARNGALRVKRSIMPRRLLVQTPSYPAWAVLEYSPLSQGSGQFGLSQVCLYDMSWLEKCFVASPSHGLSRKNKRYFLRYVINAVLFSLACFSIWLLYIGFTSKSRQKSTKAEEGKRKAIAKINSKRKLEFIEKQSHADALAHQGKLRQASDVLSTLWEKYPECREMIPNSMMLILREAISDVEGATEKARAQLSQLQTCIGKSTSAPRLQLAESRVLAEIVGQPPTALERFSPGSKITLEMHLDSSDTVDLRTLQKEAGRSRVNLRYLFVTATDAYRATGQKISINIAHQAQDAISDLETFQNEISTALGIFRSHWTAFRKGWHPQKLLLLEAADCEELLPSGLHSNIEVFESAVFSVLLKYPFLDDQLKKRDKRWRTEHTLFQQQCHPFQQAITVQANQMDIDLSAPDGEMGFFLFIKVASETRIRKQVQQGLGEKSWETRIKEADEQRALAERSAAQASEQARHYSEEAASKEQEANEARAEAAQASTMLSVFRDDFANERSRREEAEAQLRKAAAQTQALIEEKQERQEAETQRRAEGDAQLTAILQDVEDSLERERHRARDNENFRFDERYGILIAEARRRLHDELAVPNSEWKIPSETDRGVKKIAGELLAGGDAETLYLSASCMAVIQALNAFFDGRQALPDSIDAIREQNGFNWTSFAEEFRDVSELIEIWLRKYREYQHLQHGLFVKGLFPYEVAVSSLLKNEGKDPLSLNVHDWMRIWDEAPWVFLAGQQVPLTYRERKVCW